MVQTFNENVIINGQLRCSKYYGNGSGLRHATSIFRKVRNAVCSLYMETEEGDGFVGTGFFISKDGCIATAAHNVITEDFDQENEEYKKVVKVLASVSSVNGQEGNNRVFRCDIIGFDGVGDCALLKVRNNQLTDHDFLRWGDSDKLSIGDPCFVVGDPLGEDFQSISSGIIRDNKYAHPMGLAVEGLLIDAPTYQGNSGSPILNKDCKIIGILTYGPHGQECLGGGINQRLGERVVREMMMSNTDFVKGYLGINWIPVTGDLLDFNGTITQQLQGVSITNVFTNGPADNAGLQVDDIIMQIDNKKVGLVIGQCPPSGITWFKKPGDVVPIRYYRPAESVTKVTVNATLGTFPKNKDIYLTDNLIKPMKKQKKRITK